MKFKVPKEIKIGSHKVQIKYEANLAANHGKWSQSRYDYGHIVIDDNPQAAKRNKQSVLI